MEPDQGAGEGLENHRTVFECPSPKTGRPTPIGLGATQLSPFQANNSGDGVSESGTAAFVAMILRPRSVPLTLFLLLTVALPLRGNSASWKKRS